MHAAKIQLLDGPWAAVYKDRYPALLAQREIEACLAERAEGAAAEKALREGLAAVKGITGKAASGVGEPPEDLLIAKRIVRERRKEALCAVAAVQRLPAARQRLERLKAEVEQASSMLPQQGLHASDIERLA